MISQKYVEAITSKTYADKHKYTLKDIQNNIDLYEQNIQDLT